MKKITLFNRYIVFMSFNAFSVKRFAVISRRAPFCCNIFGFGLIVSKIRRQK